MKRQVKLLPLSEPLCRPSHACWRSDTCQRHLQQHSGAQRLSDFSTPGQVICSHFVAVEYHDDGPPPARHFKHWSEP